MENEKVKTLNDLDSYKWFIFYFDENSINLQFDCNKIEESLKAQRDKIKQFCIDTLTGIEHYADGFLFDTNAHIFSTPKTRGLLFSYEEYPILDTDTTKVVDGKYPLDYATEIIESNLDDIIDYMVQSGTETYNDRTSRGFGNRWSPYNEEERKQVIKLFNSGTWYDTLGSLKHLYYERTPKGLRMCNLTGEPLQANVLEHIEDIILNIKDHYERFAVVPRGKSKLQVYMTISNGTNGAEGCIINSMEDVLNVLKNLRKYKGVNWSQLLEVGIDNADDLYWWYVTFTLDTIALNDYD